MRKIALSIVTPFIICIIAGTSILSTIKVESLENLKANNVFVSTNTFKMNLVAPIISSFAACNNINMCLLALPLQTILKTTAQKANYLYVLRKLDEFQLPRELALLPIIESQYNLKAISPKGAAGLWQIMPSTAKGYGLLSNERFQLEASTNTALLCLKQLYKEFGNWEFAIAAYNTGSKRVQAALAQNPSAKNVRDLVLPIATKKYVDNFHQMVTSIH